MIELAAGAKPFPPHPEDPRVMAWFPMIDADGFFAGWKAHTVEDLQRVAADQLRWVMDR